jgi:hypothetical protein
LSPSPVNKEGGARREEGGARGRREGRGHARLDSVLMAILQQIHLRLDVIDHVDDPIHVHQQLCPVLFAPHLHLCVDLHPARASCFRARRIAPGCRFQSAWMGWGWAQRIRSTLRGVLEVARARVGIDTLC